MILSRSLTGTENKMKFTIQYEGQDLDLCFRNPSQDELQQLDLVYRVRYADAMRKGAASEREILKMAEKAGTWTKEDKNAMTDLSFNLAKLESILNQGEGDEGKMEIVEKMSEMRKDLVDLSVARTQLCSHSAEYYAMEQRMLCLVSLCTYSGESKFFDGIDFNAFACDFPDELSEILKNAYVFQYDNPEDITEQWGEMKYLKDLSEKQAAEAKEAIEADAPEDTEDTVEEISEE